MAKVGFRNGVEYASGITFDDGVNILNQFSDWASWTPIIAGGTTAGTGTYVVQNGSYMRIGNLFIGSFSIQYSAHDGTGDMLLTNLPFTVNSTAAFAIGCLVTGAAYTYPVGVTNVNIQAQNATTQGFFIGGGDSIAPSASRLQMQNVLTTIRGVIVFSI